jgi:O-antigen/teichoic acid export membrane protein
MEFKIQIIPRILALAITIPAAVVMQSYWALVAGIVATKVMTVGLSYTMHPYRPRFGFAGMKYIFGFSFWEWIIGLLNMVGYRADTIIVGRFLGTAAVGVYGVGCEIAALPASEIVSPLCRALFSGFVAERREGHNGAATLIRVLSLLAVFTFPLSVGLSLVAYPLVKLGFGDEWLEAVPLIQVLGVSAMVSLFSSVGEALFSAHAWLRTILWMTAVTTGLRLLLLSLMIPHYGLLGGALTGACMSVLQEAIFLGNAMRRLKIELRAVLLSVVRPAASVCVMATILFEAGLGWTNLEGSNSTLGRDLCVTIGAGVAVYTVSLITLWIAAGRPEGAEADALLIVNRILRRG